MVSDLVLVKDLPKAVKESIEAYVGCLAGAVFKADYLNYINKAGFDNVKIISETFYPVEAMANDATAKAVMNNPALKSLDLKSIGESVASIKVSAEKRHNL